MWGKKQKQKAEQNDLKLAGEGTSWKNEKKDVSVGEVRTIKEQLSTLYLNHGELAILYLL